MLQASDGPLWEHYDVALLDLDGVVYVGREAVPHAPEHLAAAREAGLHLAYVTNNASRPPGDVGEHLRELGVDVADEDVVTSAQAAARLLAEKLPEGSAVFVIGGPGLQLALEERGLRPVQSREEDPVAVVSGFWADLRWQTVITGAILVRDGLPWVASNTDLTVPTPDGPGPGNGALVGVVARFAERDPEVAGKPEPPLFEESLRRVGGSRPLVVGDRLDTDIEGANRVGYDSLLVMTGVTDLAQLVAAEEPVRPSYVAADLGCLGRRQEQPDLTDGTASAGPWRASVRDGHLVVDRDDHPSDADPDQDAVVGADPSTDQGTGPDGEPGPDPGADAGDRDTWWQVVAAAGWAHLDTHGSAADVSDLQVPSTVASGAGDD